jgi:hypothetical protein
VRLGDNRHDAPRAQTVVARLRPVGTVALHDAGFARGRPGRPATAGAAATIGSSCVTSLALAAVSCATSGTPLASVRRWRFDPFLRRSVGFGQLFPPAQRADGGAVDDGPALIELATPAELREEPAMESLPYAGVFPRDQPAPARTARATRHLLRQQLPRDTGSKDIQDVGHHGAVRERLASVAMVTALPTRRDSGARFAPTGHRPTGSQPCPTVPSSPIKYKCFEMRS